MKGLFITHTNNFNYGANTSLSLLAKNLNNITFDVIAPFDNKRNANSTFKQMFGENLRNVYRYNLPFSSCYFNMNAIMKKKGLKDYLDYKEIIMEKNILSLIDRKKIYSLIEKEKYDFVHLNSIVLYSLLTPKYKMILHIREQFSEIGIFKKYFNYKLRKAAGVIFISEDTRKSIDCKLKKSIIINNPFDMREVKNLNKTEIQKKYGIKSDEIVFCVAGEVAELKGVYFIANAFKNRNNKNCVLLIAGQGESSETKKIKQLAQNDTRLRLLGLIEDMKEIYRMADYVIRGDEKFAMGRTCYEGLYAGCSIIIPGEKNHNRSEIIDYDKYKKKIYFYPPRNTEKLTDLLEKCSYEKTDNRIYESNLQESVNKFQSYISKI